MESSEVAGETWPPETLILLDRVDRMDEKRAYNGCSCTCFSAQSWRSAAQ